MPSNKIFGPGGALPLSLAFMVSSLALPGCSKIEEITGSQDEETKTEEVPKSGDGSKDKDEDEDAEDEDEDAEDAEDEEDEDGEGEAIAVEELRTGLDLMLSFVPDEEAQFVILRDATVVPEYVEQANRFLDGPMARLNQNPIGGSNTEELRQNFALFQKKSKEIVDALNGSGIKLDQGMAIIKPKGEKTSPLMIFASEDPKAVAELGKALEIPAGDLDECGPVEGAQGWSVCTGTAADLAAYAPAEDSAPVHKAMEAKLKGVDLNEANLLLSVNEGGEEIAAAVTTLPGLVHAAIAMPDQDRDVKELVQTLQPGKPQTLASVQPGAGFIWAKADPAKLKEAVKSDMKSAPPEAANLFGALSGEMILAGSVNPGGLILQAGMTDTSTFTPVLNSALALAPAVPQTLDGVPGSKMVLEKKAVGGVGGTADALHLGVTGVAEVELLKVFAGLHADAWAFASNNMLTVALGPDSTRIGQLVRPGGPASNDTLATLPPQLVASLEKEEVSGIMHMPMDFLQGAHMHKLVRSALKDIPNTPPSSILAAMSLVAPISSTTMWLVEPSGAPAVIHMAVQGVGNRATVEGQRALDAAHSVADGADPAAAFASLAQGFGGSAMAFAYKTRAGTEGPGGMVGSGFGAIAAGAAFAVPMVLDARNEALAEDLEVRPEDPEPVVEIKTTPAIPKIEKKPVKKDPPKSEPKKGEPKKADPDAAKDDPIVEPGRPVPPVPTPTADDTTPKKKGKKKKGKKKKGKKKKGKKKKKKTE